jgi:hypothetical protein
MFPNLSIATDNIYKFACLFGLALILASIFSFVSVYNFTLNKNISLSEAIIAIEAKKERTKEEEAKLELSNKLLNVAKSNQEVANKAISYVLGIGIFLTIYGAWFWKTKIQARDDLLANLQVEKLRAEINALKRQSPTARK